MSDADLTLYPTEEAASAAWREALAGAVSDTGGAGGACVEIGRQHLSWTALVAAAADEAAPAAPLLPAWSEQLLLMRAVAEADVDWGASTVAGSLGAIVRGWRSASITVDELRPVTPASLARVYRAYAKLVDATGWLDAGGRWAIGCRQIATGAPIRALDGVRRVRVRGLYGVRGARERWLDALIARGLAVEVELPSSGAGDSLPSALSPLLGRIEAAGDQAPEITPFPVALPPLSLISAASPEDEARNVARRVRDELDGGAAPDELFVLAAEPTVRRRVTALLRRYGVPVLDEPPPLAEGAPAAFALSLLTALDEGASQSALSALVLQCPAQALSVAPQRLVEALRAAGVRDLATLDQRLDLWSNARTAAATENSPPTAARWAERVAAVWKTLSALLRSLPERATATEHAVRLRAVLTAFGIDRLGATTRADSAATVERRALTDTTYRALAALLDEIPRLERALDTTEISRAHFTQLVSTALGATVGRSPVRGAAVEIVSSPTALLARPIGHLFVCGAVDGALPTRHDEDSLLPDEDRLRLHRLWGRAALPLARHREAEEQAALLTLCATAGELDVSYARADAGGAPLLPSPLLSLLAERRPAERVARQIVPPFAAARAPSELLIGALLARGSRADSEEAMTAGTLLRLLGQRDPRVRDVEARADIERRRESYFQRRAAETGHRFVGRLDDSTLLEGLPQLLPGRRELPLSAKMLDSYASCGFRFFLRYLLELDEQREVQEALDPMARGQLQHRALERVFVQLDERGRLPLPPVLDATVDAEIATAVADAVAEWRATHAIGHPKLFAAYGRSLAERVRALVAREAAQPPVDGCRPSRFELRFGPLAIESGDGEPGEPLFVHGTIDRVDRAADRAVVFDYKSRTLKRSLGKERELIGRRQFQLPLYAAAVRAELGVARVEARLYSLRNGVITDDVIGDADSIALDELGRVRARRADTLNVGDSLWALQRRMRRGDFEVAPAPEACQQCEQEAACRVMRADDPFAVEGPAPASEGSEE